MSVNRWGAHVGDGGENRAAASTERAIQPWIGEKRHRGPKAWGYEHARGFVTLIRRRNFNGFTKNALRLKSSRFATRLRANDQNTEGELTNVTQKPHLAKTPARCDSIPNRDKGGIGGAEIQL